MKNVIVLNYDTHKAEVWRQVWRHITAQSILTQEEIPEEGGFKKKKKLQQAILLFNITVEAQCSTFNVDILAQC